MAQRLITRILPYGMCTQVHVSQVAHSCLRFLSYMISISPLWITLWSSYVFKHQIRKRNSRTTGTSVYAVPGPASVEWNRQSRRHQSDSVKRTHACMPASRAPWTARARYGILGLNIWRTKRHKAKPVLRASWPTINRTQIKLDLDICSIAISITKMSSSPRLSSRYRSSGKSKTESFTFRITTAVILYSRSFHLFCIYNFFVRGRSLFILYRLWRAGVGLGLMGWLMFGQ